MNREVHYIFSIQTLDYLKSAWERGRRVYLMISPIAQCRADASGNFRKAVARGDRTAASCLSYLQNTKGVDQKEGKEQQQLQYDQCWLGLCLNFQLKKALTQPSAQVLPIGFMWVKSSSHFAFAQDQCARWVSICKVLLNNTCKHAATNVSILWLLTCVQ